MSMDNCSVLLLYLYFALTSPLDLACPLILFLLWLFGLAFFRGCEERCAACVVYIFAYGPVSDLSRQYEENVRIYIHV